MVLKTILIPNTLVIRLKKGQKTSQWHSSLVGNIDKITLDAPKYNIDDIQSIEMTMSSDFSPFHADPVWSERPTVMGVLSNGNKVTLNQNDYTLHWSEAVDENDLLPWDKNLTLVAKLKGKEELTSSKTYDTSELSTLKFSNSNFTTINKCSLEGDKVAFVTKESSLVSSLPILSDGTYALKLRISNGYIQMVNGDGKANGEWYKVKELNLSHIMDITLDGETLDLSSVNLEGIEETKTSSPWVWYGSYQEITIATKTLTKGLHTLKINCKEATDGETSQEWKNGALTEKDPHGNLDYIQLVKTN